MKVSRPLILVLIVLGIWAYFGFPSPDTLLNWTSAKDQCVQFAEKHKDVFGADKTIQAMSTWMKNGKIVVEIGAFKKDEDTYMPRICVIGGGRIEIVSILENSAWR